MLAVVYGANTRLNVVIIQETYVYFDTVTGQLMGDGCRVDDYIDEGFMCGGYVCY